MQNKLPDQLQQFLRLITQTSTFLFIVLVHCSAIAQKEKETGYERSIQVLGMSGLSLGTQTISIPPLSTKVSAGIAYSAKRSSYYILPGVTFGLVYAGYHVESGFRYRFATIDHSFDRIQASHGGYKYRSNNINLGCIIQLNAKGSDDLWLWLKAGKSYYLSGYTDEYPPGLMGYNFEIKVVYMFREKIFRD